MMMSGQKPSGKFKERLALKQRQIEEMMMENRLRKLDNENQRLEKQISVANKHFVLAE